MEKKKVDEIILDIQWLKLDAWKGGYLSGIGKRPAAWKMRPVLNKRIEEIRKKLEDL